MRNLKTVLCLAAASTFWGAPVLAELDEQTLVDTYIYTLGRMLVLRQEHIDFTDGGYDWNVMFHREPGKVSWANPNLDVAYGEAWVAVDAQSCTLVNVPDVTDRYYTVQFLDPWGEVVANLNELRFPDHPHGSFAMCLEGADVELPKGALRVDLPSEKARILARVELKGDVETATDLLGQLTLTATGTPEIAPAVQIPMFANDTLMGVELYEKAEEVFASAPDPTVSNAAELQAKTLEIGAMLKDDESRARIAQMIAEVAVPAADKVTAAYGTQHGGWGRTDTIGMYGDDYTSRMVVNRIGIWANDTQEVIYFTAGSDAAGNALDGGKNYVLNFPAGENPSDVCKAFWSVTMVGLPDYLVIPNALDRFNLNNVSPMQPNADGSLTIGFGPELPADVPEANWLPTRAGAGFSTTFRCYRPTDAVRDGSWFAPDIVAK